MIYLILSYIIIVIINTLCIKYFVEINEYELREFIIWIFVPILNMVICSVIYTIIKLTGVNKIINKLSNYYINYVTK